MLRLSRQDDILRFDYRPTCEARFYGLTAWAGRRAVGMAGVAKTLDDGRLWGFCVRAPDYAEALGKGLHRKALRFLAGLRRNGVTAIYATCGDVPRSDAWLKRLGFTETDERADDGKIVMMLRLD